MQLKMHRTESSFSGRTYIMAVVGYLFSNLMFGVF